MRIAIDAREACSKKRTGKGQWSLRFIEHLTQQSGHTYILLTVDPVPDAWIKNESVESHTFAPGMRWHFAAKKFMLHANIDVYISPTSFIVPYLLGYRISTVPVIHDLIAFKSGKHDKKARSIERILLRRVLKKASHIATVSGATKDDLLQKYAFLRSENITPIFAGPFEDSPPLNRADKKIIACIGTLCPRKNQLRLIEGYTKLPEYLRKEFTLVIAGARGWADEAIVSKALDTKGVEWIGYITDQQYSELLTHCSVLAHPSLYEGFGLQVLDALQRGVPVLTSQEGSLQEVTGECAVHIDPYSTQSIADGLELILVNKSLRQKLSLQGPKQAVTFTWNKTANAMHAILAKLV